MRFISCARTDVGQRRKINQDAFYRDDTKGLYIVTDGMGGHAAGEVAAQEAIDAILGMVARGAEVIESFRVNPVTKETTDEVCRLMESAIQAATYMVFGMAEQSPEHRGMGTTVSMMVLVGAHALLGQVGDSRIYRIRDDETVQLTEDHTLINWQIREGMITPEEARFAKQKNVITRAVGSKDYVEVDTQVISVSVGDRFLLCSDGLHGYLKRIEIAEILSEGLELGCDMFISLANDRGGKDNITALAVEITG